MVHLVLAISAFLVLLIRNKKVLSFSFVILFVFAALRYDFGNDYDSYLNCFNYIKNGQYNPFDEEVLYAWLNKISPSFSFLIVLTSAVFLYAVYVLIKNNVSEEYFGIAFLIFVINPYIFLMNLSALRQCLATAVFIFAVQFAKKKKIILYIALIIVASLFHKSAIVLLPFYFWANEKKVKSWQIVAIVSVLLVLLLSPESLNQLIEIVLEFFQDANYDYYYSNELQNSLRATLLSSVYLIYVLINITKLEGKTLMYSKLYMVAMIFAVLAYKLSMMTRLQMYFDIFSLVSLPGIIEYNYKKNQDLLSKVINVYAFPALILVIYLLRYYSFFINPLWESFTTYQTIFGVS